MTNEELEAKPRSLSTFETSLAKLPDGYCEGQFAGRPWGVTVKRSIDQRRIWLFGEERGGAEIVSFNFYLLSTAGPVLKPCEISSDKVFDFVLGFEPNIVRMTL